MHAWARISRLAEKTFALWVMLAAAAAYQFPGSFTQLANWVTPLLGVVMFGMGLTLSWQDFQRIAKQPKSVMAGVIAQFLIMPLAAWAIATVLGLPPELAVGLILVGACPGGTASNVMVYLSRGNVPLSVTMTSVSTLLAPLITPVWLWVLAESWLPVEPGPMVLSILQVILLPITFGIIVRRLFPSAVKKATSVLPLISVTAIVWIIAVVVALNADHFSVTAGVALMAVILHNAFGLLLGYGAARGLKLNETDSRAVSLEVGMQNSGLGVALALAHVEPAAALPGALFSIWHNISGPLLATWWSQRNPAVHRNPVAESTFLHK
ncbi:bile acid:sodium symporter family protein [Desmospora profundinema]|uniref:BASS family bile acid:Na+ symporter n=1 Tax=Desmospora profundinema TaxID=1571184 RepID=A0ABU1IRJ8_9BACL|nr:bile acid:sodium symporter family protein [Desmospora profundinema]MDR6226559.1 BASS family bile acid:Na+ symporter [Desmospora profundinema]